MPAGRRASGRVRVPSSKSLTHRYLNLALLAGAPLALERPLLAEDTRLFLAALGRCGFRVEEEGETVRLTPGAVPPAAAGPDGIEIFCGNAGTLLRFLVASLAAVPGRWRLDGVPRLRERPVGPLVDALRRLGARIEELENPGFVPLRIAGGTLGPGVTKLDAGESSQYFSALLMAALRAPGEVVVEVESLTSQPYVDVTLAVVAELGGRIEQEEERSWRVYPSRLAPPANGAVCRVRVEGDASAACYPAAAAALTGGEVVLEGLSPTSRQGDRRFLDLLAAMGAEVGESGGEVIVRGSADGLRGIEADLSRMPDQVPTLAALAPFARGVTRIFNVAHLRIKESDRLAAMAAELRRVGAEVEEGPDSLTIPGIWADREPPAGPGEIIEVDPYGDHRIAMSMALVGLRRPGVVVRSPEVVAKSYPDFWRDFFALLEGSGRP